jgi:hypothetical protein
MVEFNTITAVQMKSLLTSVAPRVRPDFQNGEWTLGQPSVIQPLQVAKFNPLHLDIQRSFAQVATLTEVSKQILDLSGKEIVFPSGSFGAEKICLKNQFVAVCGLGEMAFLEVKSTDTPEDLGRRIKAWYHEYRELIEQGERESYSDLYEGKTLQDQGPEKSYKWVRSPLPSFPNNSLRARNRQAALYQVIFGVCGIACVGIGILALRHFYSAPRITA